MHEVRQQASPPPDNSEDTQRKQQEIERLQRFWNNRLEAYKKQNEELKQKLDSLNNKQLQSPALKLDSKLTDAPSCQQEKLQKCLETYSQQPLKCCREVKDFVKSVTEV